VGINEAWHHHPSPAINDASLQPPRLGVESAICPNPKDLSVRSQNRPAAHDSKLAQAFTTARSGPAREGQELFSVSEKERRWRDRHLTEAAILLEYLRSH
jgi:hypothetical protein